MFLMIVELQAGSLPFKGSDLGRSPNFIFAQPIQFFKVVLLSLFANVMQDAGGRKIKYNFVDVTIQWLEQRSPPFLKPFKCSLDLDFFQRKIAVRVILH